MGCQSNKVLHRFRRSISSGEVLTSGSITEKYDEPKRRMIIKETHSQIFIRFLRVTEHGPFAYDIE